VTGEGRVTISFAKKDGLELETWDDGNHYTFDSNRSEWINKDTKEAQCPFRTEEVGTDRIKAYRNNTGAPGSDGRIYTAVILTDRSYVIIFSADKRPQDLDEALDSAKLIGPIHSVAAKCK